MIGCPVGEEHRLRDTKGRAFVHGTLRDTQIFANCSFIMFSEVFTSSRVCGGRGIAKMLIDGPNFADILNNLSSEVGSLFTM